MSLERNSGPFRRCVSVGMQCSAVAVLALGAIGAARAQARRTANPPAVKTQAAHEAFSARSSPTPSTAQRSKLAAEYGKLPLAFELNQGQADPRVKFLSRGVGYTLFLTQTAAIFQLVSPAESCPAPKPFRSDATTASLATPNPQPMRETVLRIRLEGANPQAVMRGLDRLPGKTNYLIGRDRSRWTTNVPNFGAVEYRGVYPGIASIFHGNPGALEWDFRLAPEANPRRIFLHIGGAKQVRINSNGDAVLKVGDHTAVTLRRPAAYQMVEGIRRQVSGKFEVRGVDEIGFAVGPYDRSLPLVIDPAVVYSTYLGPNSDVVYGPVQVAVDSEGNAYIAGTVDNANNTSGLNYPTTSGAFEPATQDNRTAFVTKLNATGSALVYSTFLSGTTGGTSASALGIDSSGDAYVTGYVIDNDFPTTSNAFEPECAVSVQYGVCIYQGYLAKLSPDGSGLLYSTYLGATTSGVEINALAVDSAGSAYVAGVTFASDLPVKPNPGAYLTSCNLNTFTGNTCAEEYGFVAKFDPSSSGANSLVYSTYLGGVLTGTQIAVDSTGDAYIGGSVEIVPDATFPITTRFSSYSTGGFVTKLNASGTSVIYSDLLGAAGSEGLALDSTGAAYVVGQAPLPGGGQLTPSADIAVTKLDPTGATVVYSEALGGSGADTPYGLAVDGNGDAFVAGVTGSTDFPTTVGAPQTTFTGYSDAFLTGLTPDGSTILFSTYFGGSSDNDGTGVALDASGDAYLTGWTESTDFPISSGAFLTSCLGINYCTQCCHDAFITEFSGVAPPAPTPFANFSPTSIDFGDVAVGQVATRTVTLSNTGKGPLTLQVVAPVSSNFPFNYDPSSTNTCNGVAVPQPLSSQPVTVNPASSCTFTLQFTPGSTGPASGQMGFQDNAGTSQTNLPVTALRGGEFQQNVPLSGTGTQPDFSISASPSSVAVTAGNSGQATISVSALNGFTDTVNLAASGAPAGVTASFSHGSITGGSGGSTLTLATTSTTAAGTYPITVTGTDASGQPSHSTTVSLTVNASSSAGGGGGSSSACTCNLSTFAAPNTGVASKNDPTTSPNDKYTVAYTSTSLTVTRVKDAKVIINDMPFAPGFAWGFSPDDDRLLVDTISGSQESVYVYDLVQNPSYNPTRSAGQPIGPTPVMSANLYDSNTPSRLVWSSSGVYLLFAALTQQNYVNLYIYNVLTHTKVVDTAFTFQTPSSGSDKLGMAAWGFSPGTPEVSFLYDYTDSSGAAELNAVNLDSGVTIYSQNEPSNTTWQFTACGDALQVTLPNSSPQLYSTIKLNTVITSYNSCSTPNALQSNFPDVVEPIDQTTETAPKTPVTLLLSNVSANTQISLTSSSAPPSTPSGFKFGNPPIYFDLTATPSFPSGASATICINFSGTAFANASSVTLQHYVNPSWVPLVSSNGYTVTLDTVNDVVCVSDVASFSPFALVEPVSPPATPTVQLITTLPSAAPPTTDADGNYIVSLLLTNNGNVTANGTEIAAAGLVSVVNSKTVSTPTSTPLPVYLGDIAPGGSVIVPVSFPASAGTPGNGAAVRVGLTYSGGSAAGTLRLTLP